MKRINIIVIRKEIPYYEELYFITMTCARWISLFEITQSYDDRESINKIVAKGKRFMAYAPVIDSNRIYQGRQVFRSFACATLLWLFVLLPVSLSAQDTQKTLTAYFKEVRAGQYKSIPKNLFQPENAKTTLSLLTPYLKDTSAVVRAKAYAIVQLTGGTARASNLREDAVTKLVDGVKDHDSGNAGLALGYLEDFKKDDFTQITRDTLLNLFNRKTAHYDLLIRLIGFLELKQTRDNLRALSQQSNASKKERWSALLALARMDDVYAIESVMSRVKKLPVNDEVVYQIFPDLVYTRQRPVFDLLTEALNSDANNCEAANAESDAKIPCAYRVMEMLAGTVANYPLTLDESGDIQTKDYKAALATVREWFKKNKEYTIVKDNY